MNNRLTMAQALVRFLANQYSVLDEQRQRFVTGIFGIFGHGNVTGLGEALENAAHGLTYYQGHNEQGMAHAAIAYAKQKNRLAIMPCTSSIGPGATNMVSAAATATINRIPLLLLPGDVFSCRQPDPVLQQLEVSYDGTLSVNDCFKPVSRYWDRIMKPEQLISACMNAMRVLTDPSDTGTVTLCIPQDVQTHAYAFPEEFFVARDWYIDRQTINQRAIEQALHHLVKAQRPLIIVGGGVHYAQATTILSQFAAQHAIPVAETQAGKSALAAEHPWAVGGIGVTGTATANYLAAQADVILVIGSRLQDFTTASKGGFNSQAQLIHLNCSRFDGLKMNALMLHGDAKVGLEQLSLALGHYQTPAAYQQQVQRYQQQWQQEREYATATQASGLAQTAILRLLNQFVSAEDVVIGAAGSLPGDLHRLWQSKQAKDYHVEYGYSCMGYEVAAGLGVRLAQGAQGEVYVLVGDGSYLMMHSELLTCIQEQLKITIIIFDNHGFQCIKQLQTSKGSAGFGNEFRYREQQSARLHGDYLPIDFSAYAAALGAEANQVHSETEFIAALSVAKCSKRSSVIVVPVLPTSMSKSYHTWWRVDVAEVSQSATVRQAYQEMQEPC